ncbi:signal peptidase I [Lachnospiraceae bacterium NSJ-143]|nr:signal peptidase I [Lachnospiraceae bacterium NSJ-143]
MGELAEKRRKTRKNELKEWVMSLVIVVLLALIVRFFVFGTVEIKGISMEPTFYHGNIIVVNKLSYKISKPKRGDIIVCSYDDIENEILIKRVIGLSGDTVDFVPDSSGGYNVSINGEILNEEYTKEGTGFYGDMQYPYTVPEGSYFVMGDNRDNSTDSRWQSIGAIKKDGIIGKAMIKVWPLG